MAVKLRMKRMGKKHRPFFRISAVDTKTKREGRVLEELGHYDPLVSETDARAALNVERIDYWLSVGAQPSEKVGALIKKYGSQGTHLEAQKAAHAKLGTKAVYQPAKVPPPKPKEEPAAAPAEGAAPAEAEAPAAEAAPAEGS